MTIALERIREDYAARREGLSRRVIVCAGTGCVAGGALDLHARLAEACAAADLKVEIHLDRHDCGDARPRVHLSRSGCQGFCQMGPLLMIEPDGILYTKVKLGDVEEIVEATLSRGEAIERLLYHDPVTQRLSRGVGDIPFYQRQERLALRDCGRIDPEDIEEYIHGGGYLAARMAYAELSPEAVCEEVTHAGLRGRGGGGFPTGRKWALTLKEEAARKYVICNGDEGDPGAFMDRSLMEGDPHAVLEGMLIAARAIGATHGYVYVRLEYPLAVERVRRAVREAEARGVLGARVFGTRHAFHVEVMEGAGAFVCGEETALIASIEGKRGMPRPKPPFPAQRGLWGCPTVINNVETLATVPRILREGARAFRARGTSSSPGTKTFALTGHVANTGLIEVPFGSTLREIVFQIGGGVTDDAGAPQPDGFKAVQIGGPSGGCLTEDHLDLPLDFDSLKAVDAMVGSGGLVVMNQATCAVQMARFFMQFTQDESCGKCVLCREGTRQMLALLDDIIEGEATPETLDLLEELAHTVQKGSLCGLGKTAPNPVLSMMRRFRGEYEAHVSQKRCPSGRCKALVIPAVVPELCKGCGLCARKCPVNAISGKKREPYVIDPEGCIRCGVCAEVCRFDAVVGV